MSQESRPKGRRRIVAAAAVLAVVVGGGYVAVSPAAAELCDEEAVFFCAEDLDSAGDLMPEREEDTLEPIEEDQSADEPVDEDSELLPEEESEPEATDSDPAAEQSYTQEHLLMFQKAYDGVHALLVKSDNKCRDLISRGLELHIDAKGNVRLGPELAKAKPGRPAPRDVLSAVFDAGNLKLNPFFESPVVTEPGKTAPAVSVGSGKSGHIELYKRYFGEEPAALHTYMNPPKPLSDPDGRMLILLHELAHLMGTLPGNEDFKDIREKLVYPFNAQIVRDCVKNH